MKCRRVLKEQWDGFKPMLAVVHCTCAPGAAARPPQTRNGFYVRVAHLFLSKSPFLESSMTFRLVFITVILLPVTSNSLPLDLTLG